jgi:hypothetical protein
MAWNFMIMYGEVCRFICNLIKMEIKSFGSSSSGSIVRFISLDMIGPNENIHGNIHNSHVI